jgi:hypothetical protein
MYTATGSVRVDGSGKTILSATKASSSVPTALTPNASIPNRTLYVRNLSIYEGGHIYTGLSFIGEARSTMFRQGKFPIVMVDAYGKVVGVSTAAAENDWTVPGWVRFNTKIEYVLPKNMPCTMVFEEAQFPDERAKKAPTRVPLATRCN